MEQRAKTLLCWFEPFVPLRGPKIFNLRRDPYERADITSNTYWDWLIDRAFAIYGAQMLVGNFLATFEKYPPRGEAASFTIGDALEKIKTPPAH